MYMNIDLSLLHKESSELEILMTNHPGKIELSADVSGVRVQERVCG